MKVALVVMPWLDIEAAPLGVAALKAYLKRQGIDVQVHYLNIRMAKRIGSLMRSLSRPRSYLWPEWFFAQSLFGAKGEQEMAGFLHTRPLRDEFAESGGLRNDQVRYLLDEAMPAFLEECLEDIPWSSYDLIGFSSVMYSHTACLKMAYELKKRFPDKPIVFGGSNVEGEMGAETLRACEWIDYVVSGEGEETFCRLIRQLERGERGNCPPGVLWRERGEVRGLEGKAAFVDMNALPTPDHDDYIAELRCWPELKWANPEITFEASRGCWWGAKQHCTFCGLNGDGISYRSKDSSLVLSDILGLHRRYKVLKLRACDEILAMDHLRDLVPRLAQAREDMSADWEIFFNVKANLTEPQTSALARAGVRHLQAGIEHLSTPVLKLMRKGVSGIQNIRLLKAAESRGISLYWYILYGFPGERAEDYASLPALIARLVHLNPPGSLRPVRLDRFSPYHANPERYGLKDMKPDAAYRFIYPEPRFSIDKIAYFFGFTVPEGSRLPYLPALRKAVDWWRETSDKTFFAYRQGAEHAEIHDARPVRVGGTVEYRVHALEGLEQQVFKASHTLQSFGQIHAECKTRFPACSETEVRAALGEMEGKGWVLREENLYLNLAVPLSTLRPAQKFLFDRFQRIGV